MDHQVPARVWACRITGKVIGGNAIQQETNGIVAKTNALVEAHLNDFIDVATGVDNLSGSLPNDARASAA